MDPFRDLLCDPVAELLLAITLMAASGLPGLLLKKPDRGRKAAAALLCLAAVPGLTGAGRLIAGGQATAYTLLSPLPFAPFTLSADPLSALFLLPLFLVSACCGVYAVAYRPAADHPAAERKLSLFFGLLPAAMAMVLLARHGVLLLMSWEVMALSAYFLVTTDQRDPAVQRAGAIYLLATHSATMALFIVVALLKGATGTFDFPGPHALLAGDCLTAAILLLALVGFGSKAGIMPLHIWLPGAHANAPSHVSAVMSGLMLKMGVYGILRTASFFGAIPLWFGGLVLLLGAVSALTGIALAGAQRDLKRLLACSSIENVGIILLGAGLAFVGLQTRNQTLAVLGLTGLFMHIINHALFKPLLFLGAGTIIHAAGTREMDRMGGLGRHLPLTAPLFLTGTLAICGLPPLNGFVGELFIYMAAFVEGTTSPLPLLGLVAPLLAIVGGMALLAFVKLHSTVLLGQPRSPSAHHHGESTALVAPMAILALSCLVLGLAAPLELSLVAPVVGQYAGLSAADVGREAAIVPLQSLMVVNISLLLLLLAVAATYLRRLRRLPPETAPTWGCGYLAPSPRMQYTATSFSQQATHLLGVVARPRCRPPVIRGAFPGDSTFSCEATETILDRLLAPLFHGAGIAFSFLRRLQHGHLHLYMLYIFATLFVLMVWRH